MFSARFLFTLLTTIASFSAFSLSDAQNSTITCKCASDSVIYNAVCYCDNEATNMAACLKKSLPDWPFDAPASNTTSISDCPNPITDSSGFTDCINKKVPKLASNYNQVAQDCVAQMKSGNMTQQTTSPPPTSMNDTQPINSSNNQTSKPNMAFRVAYSGLFIAIPIVVALW